MFMSLLWSPLSTPCYTSLSSVIDNKACMVDHLVSSTHQPRSAQYVSRPSDAIYYI